MDGKLVEVVDRKDRVVGTAPRSEVHETGALHRAVHMWVFNREAKLFLQKRFPDKPLYPNLWESSVGKQVKLNESYEEAALRGLKEELNLSFSAGLLPIKFGKTDFGDGRNRELITLFTVVHDGRIKIHTEKMAEGQFFGLYDVRELVKENKVTPSFRALFKWWGREKK